MIALSSSAKRLREELHKEGLSKFDDETLRFLATSLEGDQIDNEEIVEAWSPFLLDQNDTLETDSARNVCLGILQRLKSSDSADSTTSTSISDSAEINFRLSPFTEQSAASENVENSSEVPGLRDWLKRLRLEAYYAAALAWCHDVGAADISEVKEFWEDLRDALDLRPLEIKRMSKEMEGASLSPEKPFAPNGSGGRQNEPEIDVMQISRDLEAKREEPAITRHQIGGTTPNSIPYTYDPINDKLGSGATADVYRCCRLEEGQTKEYAVKSVRLEKLKLRPDFPEIKERMGRETQILFKLRHANVVSLYDVVLEENKIHLIMDLVEGGDLFAKIPRQLGMQEIEARFIFLQLVYALQYIHGQNVVHRDLKPENILVDQKASRGSRLIVKLTDFGHSKSLDDGYSVAHTKVGTSQYWAPEVAASNGLSAYDASVDLWSLGVTLYLMLEGTYPFQGDAQHREAEFSFNDEETSGRRPCSSEARDLIRKLIVVSPKDRISLDKCLEHPWVIRLNEACNEACVRVPKAFKESADEEERFVVPGESRLGIKHLRTELATFSQLNTCSAEARKRGEQREVVVTWSRNVTEHQLQESRRSLTALLKKHFPDLQPELEPIIGTSRNTSVAYPVERQPSGLKEDSDRSSTTCSVSPAKTPTAASFRLLQSIINVDKVSGAGLDLCAEPGKGMVVEEVLPNPGQPLLQKGDIIIRIAQVSLACKSMDEINETFGQHFEDGVKIQIKRRKGYG